MTANPVTTAGLSGPGITTLAITNDEEDNEGPDLNISKLVLVNNVYSQEWRRSTPLKTYSKKTATSTPNMAAVSRYGRSHKPRIADGFLSTDKKVSQYLKIDADNQLHYFKSSPYSIYKSPNSKSTSSSISSGSNSQQSSPRKRGRPPKIRTLSDSGINITVGISSGGDSVNNINGSTAVTATKKRYSVGDKLRPNVPSLQQHRHQAPVTELNLPIPTSTETLPIPPELMDQAILGSSDIEESEENLTEGEDILDIVDPLANSPAGTTVEMGPDGQPRWMVGDLAWACVGGFPYWPCTVTRDPFENAFTKLKFIGKFRQARDLIHVRFFGDHGRRSWIYKGNILPFLGLDEFLTLAEQKCTPKTKKKFPKLYRSFSVTSSVRKAWQAAVSEAESLKEAPRSERVKYFMEAFPSPPLPINQSPQPYDAASLENRTPIPVSTGKRGRKSLQAIKENQTKTSSTKKRKPETALSDSGAKKIKLEVKDEPKDLDEVMGTSLNTDEKIKEEPETPQKKVTKSKPRKNSSKCNSIPMPQIQAELQVNLTRIKIKEEITPKRMRGRPRKYPKLDTSAAETPPSSSTTTPTPTPTSVVKKKIVRKSVVGVNRKSETPNGDTKNNNNAEKKTAQHSSQLHQQTASLEQSSLAASDNFYQQERKKSKLGPGFASFCEKHFDQVADEDPSLTSNDVNKYLEKMWLQLSDAVKARYRSKIQEEIEVESESDTETDSRPSPPQTITSGSSSNSNNNNNNNNNKPVKRGVALFSGVKSDKVCSVCFKSGEPGEIIKCKGPCCNYFHIECSTLPRYQQSRFSRTISKKKKRGRPRTVNKHIVKEENVSTSEMTAINKQPIAPLIQSNGILENSAKNTLTEEVSSCNSEESNIKSSTTGDEDKLADILPFAEHEASNQKNPKKEKKKNDQKEKTKEVVTKEKNDDTRPEKENKKSKELKNNDTKSEEIEKSNKNLEEVVKSDKHEEVKNSDKKTEEVEKSITKEVKSDNKLEEATNVDKKTDDVKKNIKKVVKSDNKLDEVTNVDNKTDDVEKNIKKVITSDNKLDEVTNVDKKTDDVEKNIKKVIKSDNKLEEVKNSDKKSDDMEQSIKKVVKSDNKLEEVKSTNKKTEDVDRNMKKVVSDNRHEEVKNTEKKSEEMEKSIKKVVKSDNKLEEVKNTEKKTEEVVKSDNKLEEIKNTDKKTEVVEKSIKKVVKSDNKLEEVKNIDKKAEEVEKNVKKSDQMKKSDKKFENLEKSYKKIGNVGKTDQKLEKVEKRTKKPDKVKKSDEKSEKVEKGDNVSEEMGKSVKKSEEEEESIKKSEKVEKIDEETEEVNVSMAKENYEITEEGKADEDSQSEFNLVINESSNDEDVEMKSIEEAASNEEKQYAEEQTRKRDAEEQTRNRDAEETKEGQNSNEEQISSVDITKEKENIPATQQADESTTLDNSSKADLEKQDTIEKSAENNKNLSRAENNSNKEEAMEVNRESEEQPVKQDANNKVVEMESSSKDDERVVEIESFVKETSEKISTEAGNVSDDKDNKGSAHHDEPAKSVDKLVEPKLEEYTCLGEKETEILEKDIKISDDDSTLDLKKDEIPVDQDMETAIKVEESTDNEDKMEDLKLQDLKPDKRESSNDDKQSIDSDKSNDKQSIDSDKSQTGKSGWMCNLCIEGKDGPCFICGLNTGDLIRCSTTYCGKVYHVKCLASWPQRQIGQGFKGRLILYCPQHTCHTCISDNPAVHTARYSSDKLVRCVACPSSYHYGNYCIPAGSELLSTTQMICPRHYVPMKDSLPHVNASWCSICAIGGSLICCDSCPNSFHAECLKIDPPEGSFICEDCETGRIPLYGEVVWVKLGTYRWWPAKILYPMEVPENIRTMNHSPVGEFVVEFFGSHDYFWINRGRAFFYHEGDGANILCKNRVDELFILGMNEASEAFRLYQEERESREANCRPSMKPPKYVKIQTNKPYGTLRSAESDVASMTACECDPEKENPCGRNSDCINRLLMVECNPQICPAGEKCHNQNFEKRLYPPLTPFKTETRGWGLKTLIPLKKGDFVIEYVGEMIDEEEYKKRVIRKQKNKDENYYFLTIDKDRMLDAGPKGNMARFMNHSCNPNCETQKWTVNGDTRVGLFTLVDISAGAELVFNYNLETIGNTRVDCKCGAPSCGGYIGAKAIKQEEKKTTVTANSKKKKQPKKSVGNNGATSNKGSSTTTTSTKVTENTCFTCGEGGELLLCDHSSCPKAYHLDCLGLTKHPPGNWECPRHVCSICSSTKVQRCTHCINSYCDKHAEGNITLHRSHGLVCFSCTPSESGSDWSGEPSDDEKPEIPHTVTIIKTNSSTNNKSNKLLTSRRGRPLIPNGNLH